MYKSDAQLQLDVLEELKWEPSVDAEQIGVAAKDGVVTLSGIVGSYSEKLLAEKTARRVDGVRAIAEELAVRYASDPKTSDSEIARRVADIMEWDALMPNQKIDVTVDDGVVSLKGEVDWGYQKNLAFKDASKISGVKRVDNWIVVKPAVGVGDLKERIEQAFERQADFEANKIRVTTQGHKVILDGRVASWDKRSIAERAAWAAPGVSQVVDNLIVG
jgi:osmotically-inducible protein OsmY